MPKSGLKKVRSVALAWGARLGPSGFRRVVSHFGSTLEVIEATPAELAHPGLRLSSEQIAAIAGLRLRLEYFAHELERLQQERISVFCDWEEGFPRILLDLRNPPVVICVAGSILPHDEPAVGIIGTRTPTDDGSRMARSLGRAFGRIGTTVVSGLARGCDTAAHEGALEGGGRTLAVLGSGIRVITPRENLALARRVFERGAVISEQPPSAEADTPTLMARNRLTSGLSRGIIVVQSRARGGAMATAKHATDQGRLLYAVQWDEPGEWAEGTAELLEHGAEPVRGPQDVEAIRLALADHLSSLRDGVPGSRAQRPLFEL